MRFEWDETKRKANLRKHGVDFACAASVFDGITVTVVDARYDYEEDRFISFGLWEGHVVVIAHTEREDSIRIISMRRATKNEEKSYFEAIPSPDTD